ncbi:MAG: hypothetical protein LUD15_06410 [Bacteroides sp.]|nr:hypothetical protein [Bacteroides sp.]
MVKMVAPDYTVIFHYREKPQEEEDWLMIWKENERAKFRNKWYLISSGNRESISRMLEDQRN